MYSIKNISLNILFSVGVLISLAYFVYRDSILVLFFSIIGFLLLAYFLGTNLNKYIHLIVFLIVFFVIYLVKCLYFQSIAGFVDSIWFISHFGFALYLVEQKSAFGSVKLIYTLLTLFIFITYIVEGTINDISSVSSANMVNYIYMAFTILLINMYYKNNDRIILLPVILNLLVSFISLGRAGIIISIFLLTATVLIKYKNKFNKLTLGLIFLISPILITYIYNVVIDFILDVLTKFGSRSTFFEDSARDRIWTEYFLELDLKKVIFGYGDQIQSFGGFTNLHNSFIEFHYTFGIGALFVIIVILISLVYFIKNRLLFNVLLITCLLLRSMTDIVMLVWMYDFVFVYMMLVSYKQIYKSNSYGKLKIN